MFFSTKCFINVFYPMRAICSAYLSHLELMTVTILREEYKLEKCLVFSGPRCFISLRS